MRIFSKQVRMTTSAKAALGATVCLFASAYANAAGYEKSVTWSGRYSGVAGAATSTVIGAEGLYFNPAGMVAAAPGQNVSVNFSPTFAQFKGPAGANDSTQTSKASFNPVYGLVYSNTLTPDLAVGVGIYVAGGADAKFENVPFTYAGGTFTTTPKVQTMLQMQEISLGAAYRIMPGLKVGAAWRVSMASAELASAQVTPFPAGSGGGYILQTADISGLKDTEYNGFRLGAQFAPDENWGVGVSLRTEINFKAKGTATGSYEIRGNAVGPLNGPGTISITDTTATTTFPMQLSLGGHYDFVPKEWRGIFQYDFTQYSRNKDISYDSFGTATIGGAPVRSAIPNTVQNWKDQHSFRFAGEYTATQWPVRFGYIIATPVEEKGYARPNFIAPGYGNTLTVGTGHQFMDNLAFNAGLEYSWASATVGSSSQVATYTGNYASYGYALHLGLDYAF